MSANLEITKLLRACNLKFISYLLLNYTKISEWFVKLHHWKDVYSQNHGIYMMVTKMYIYNVPYIQ